MRKYRSFKEAREFVRSLKLKGWDDWQEYCLSGKRPDDIPALPNKIVQYKNEWIDMGDWLGNDKFLSKTREILPLKDAIKIGTWPLRHMWKCDDFHPKHKGAKLDF